MVDGDVIDVGTSVRFPHGHEDAGRYKVPTIQSRLLRNWPTTEPNGVVLRLGGPGWQGMGSRSTTV